MAQRNPKLIEPDFLHAPAERRPPQANGAGAGGHGHEEPDTRTLMNQLQQTAFELRHRLSAVEDERDTLVLQVEMMQEHAPGGGRAPEPSRAVAAPEMPVRRPAEPPARPPEEARPRDELSRSVEGLRRALTESEQRSIAAQTLVQTLRQARDTAQAQNRELSQKLEQAQYDLADLRDELGALAPSAPVGEISEADAAAAEHAATDREEARRVHAETVHALADAQQQLQQLRAEREEGAEERRELAMRLEAQRIETIDLATRFQGAKEEIRTLSAKLAEARLQARVAPVPPPSTPPPPAPVASVAPVVEKPAVEPEAETGGVSETVAVAAPLTIASLIEPLPPSAAQSALKEMRRCYQAYARDPEDLSHLNELHCIIHSFAEEARGRGLAAIHRIAAAAATLVHDLYNFPEQIGAGVLSTVVQSIEFLAMALKLRDPRQLRDPAATSVCVVDDDAATCECIVMAMESVAMQPRSYLDPAQALCELSSTGCDLIILDVQMPGMDGFELCSEIRQQEHHRDTPVLFLTGQSAGEVRARSILSGGSDFMTKPFLLCELGLKGLMLSAKAQLHMV